MGILSTRSLAAPFLDKRNFIAILLIGVFFVVYRLSGGSISTVPKGSKIPLVKPPAQKMFFEDFTSSPQDVLKSLKGPESTNNKKDFLGGLLNNNNSKNEKNSESADPNRTRLDDIERSLGLR
jgi:hypothetical protein